MAALLSGSGLPEEEREALNQAILWLSKALSVENRIEAPGSLDDALRAPYAILWGDGLATIRDYGSNPSAAAAAAANVLRALIGWEG